VIKYSTSDLFHSHWLGSSIEEDANAIKSIISGYKFHWLVVDHYALDSRWESALKSDNLKIMTIDDLADRKHNCDILLDQNFFGDSTTQRYERLLEKPCKTFLGPQYALLNKSYRELSKNKRIRSKVENVLIFFG